MATRWEITKAVRASKLPPPSRLVMLTLADIADVGTAEIPARRTPSVAQLASETGHCKRTVQDHLDALEGAGWLTRTRPATPQEMWRGDRVRYQLHLPAEVAQEIPESDAGDAPPQVQEMHHPDAGDAPGVVQEMRMGGASDAPLETDLSYQVSDQIKEPSSQPSAAKREARGTRLPDDFKVTPEMRSWAMANVPELAGSRETEKFINYWRSIPAARGRKTDWVATWRNWMLKAAEQRAGRASPNLVDHNGFRLKPETAQRFADRARFQAMDDAAAQLAIEGTAL